MRVGIERKDLEVYDVNVDVKDNVIYKNVVKGEDEKEQRKVRK